MDNITIFNNEIMEKNLSEMEVIKLLSKLLVKTILKIGKVESNKSTKEKSHIIILEKASIMREELRKEVLFCVLKFNKILIN
ncbi:16781_t:CDS:2 [Funneliformis caledonium]|uniref:16781_t:CDS:1 n=1 Tax=Funneliformis caledonium TaxID=1117310 RepID=A0A9N9ADN5_9GLOM|nr:16781_t:CDS:2 [Funneliformis caledonium]